MTLDNSSQNQLWESFLLPERAKRLEHVLAQRTNQITVVLDNVHNFHNISAIIRSLDAFGICDLHLIGNQFEYNRAISKGTERWTNIHSYKEPKEALAYLIGEGYKLAVLQAQDIVNRSSNNTQIMPISELPFEEKLALVFGNERNGVSKDLLSASQIHAFIPMKGFVESLNVSVACAICLFCSTISPAAPQQRCKPLSEIEQEELRLKWMQTSVRKSDTILKEIQVRTTSKSRKV